MKRGPIGLIGLALGGLMIASLTGGPGAQAASRAADPPLHRVFEATVSPGQAALIRAAGVDPEDVFALGRSGARTRVQVVLTDRQARGLRAQGLKLAEKPAPTSAPGTSSPRALQNGVRPLQATGVFRPYSGPGGLAEELRAVAAANPRLTKLVSIGHSVQGQEILAVKVTKDAQREKDGRRPAVLYISAQHAREWITPEMTRRLLHHYLDNYGTDRTITRLINTQELWFVPVANPDGYDFTFTTDRLWRKNLRDNNGDGKIDVGDGVDPNRNYATKWGYDNEGSSDNPFSDTYRGPAPASEPETQAIDGLMKRVHFTFMMNYHSAAQLLLYGTGWQVATPTPDDVVYQAMAGDDAHSAIPGYDPDLSAELYTTNGEIDEHVGQVYKTLAFTAEMSTCQTASAADPDDAFDPGDCPSEFNFPDSEPLIQAEFEKNIPFALAVATSVTHPDHPTSVVGRTTPDLVPDTFTTSYGDPQPVAVTARRSLKHKTAYWSINGGRVHKAPLHEWKGGERYGTEHSVYYAEYRATVRGARPGDRVKVWFGAQKGRGHGHGHGRHARRPLRVTSQAFTYTLKQNKKLDVLVVSDEDYKGTDPTYPSSVTAPKYARAYVDALRAAGLSASVWDTTAQGVPHPLGVLSHAKAVLWYSGENRLTQDPEDEQTSIFGDDYEDASVAERAQYLTIALRDYLNEGGKLAVTGEDMGYMGFLGSTLGGIYYGLGSDPSQDCVVTRDLFADCQLLADDFFQYYLGAYSRSTISDPSGFTGTDTPLTGLDLTFGGPGLAANPLNEAGNFTPTSSILPVAQFPQFRSWASGSYTFAAGGGSDPFGPSEGDWYVAKPHTDDAYARLMRSIDLRSVTAAQAPKLTFDLSYDTEPGYDNVIVEAHTVGADDWTTLPDLTGLSDTGVPDECEAGFLVAEHPWLEHYLTVAPSGCGNTGTSGQWNRFTGNSGGWKNVAFDLSAYAGHQVEVSISYVSDPGTGGAGAFVDRTALVLNGSAVESEGFETGLGPWTIPGPPTGSPTGPDFARSKNPRSAAISTPDTVLLGFGLEQVDGAARRAQAVAAVSALLRGTGRR